MSGLSFKEVTSAFFKKHSLDSTKVLFFKFFQCWVTKDCDVKADYTDEEIALFFDQLTDLVTAVHLQHQSSNANINLQEGGNHE